MKKTFILLNILLTASIVLYVVDYLLLKDNFLQCSISSIIYYARHLNIREHLLVLGFLPIYIAAIIFGSALFALRLGSFIQGILLKYKKKNLPPNQNSR